MHLAEVHRLVTSCDVFGVLAHVDYPARYWPREAGPFEPGAFEDELRQVLRALADSGRVLEVNTKVPLHADVVRWWRDEGGTAVTFGSDEHVPGVLAHGFPEAAAMVEALGFRPAGDPWDPWIG